MMKIYSHYVKNRDVWESLHEKESWWPSKVGDPWNTNYLVRDILTWPSSSKYFKIVDANLYMIDQGQYLVVITNVLALRELQALAFMPQLIVDKCNQGDLCVTIVYVHDTFVDYNFQDFKNTLTIKLKSLGFQRPGCVNFVTSTWLPRVQHAADDLIKYIYLPWHAGIVQQRLRDHVLLRNHDITDPSTKPKKFVSLGGTNYPHRLIMIKMLEYLGATRHGLITMQRKGQQLIDASDDLDPQFRTWLNDHAMIDTDHYHDVNDPMTGIKNNVIGFKTLYSYAGWELIMESHIELADQGVFCSEKVFRAMSLGMPWVLLGPAGSLEVLRTQGFRTFGNIVDESYDQISDSWQRCMAVANSIKQIVSWTPQQQSQHWPELHDILDHNRRLIQSQRYLNDLHQALTQ